MINTVALTGRLTNHPEIKFTSTGKTYVRFSLAVNRNYKNGDGERESDFIRCILWGKAGEAFIKFTRKGSLIGVAGRLQTQNYEKDGRKVYVTEVIVENFALLESKEVTEARETNSISNTQSNEVIEFSEDDLPF